MDFNNSPIVLTEAFFKIRTYSGLNYVNTEFSRHDDISFLFKIKYRQDPSKFIGRRWCWIFIPKTNSTLLGKDRHDDYNVAGYGTSKAV
jgi:hypothetical protein